MATTVPRWSWIAPILIYAVSALEMIIMISPAAAYFYSVYTPLFHRLEQSALTAWLPQFFLPHLAHTTAPAFRWLSWLGAALALGGLLGFLACAGQLYYGKFVKKQLVSGGLYGRVRHPQYLCLAVAGAGLLLLWPRFFILVTYLAMLGLYYVLARHEEEVIRRRYGAATEAYLASVPMFNPFRGRRTGGAWRPLPRGRAFAAWAALCVLSLGLAFFLRSVAVERLYVREGVAPDVTSLAFRDRPDSGIDGLTRDVLATTPMRELLSRKPDASLFLQITTGSSQLKHLLVDLGMIESALDAIEWDDDADYAVASIVSARRDGGTGRPHPFAFGTRIEPVLVVRFAGNGTPPETVALEPAQFYPDFSRIRF